MVIVSPPVVVKQTLRRTRPGTTTRALSTGSWHMASTRIPWMNTSTDSQQPAIFLGLSSRRSFSLLSVNGDRLPPPSSPRAWSVLRSRPEASFYSCRYFGSSPNDDESDNEDEDDDSRSTDHNGEPRVLRWVPVAYRGATRRVRREQAGEGWKKHGTTRRNGEKHKNQRGRGRSHEGVGRDRVRRVEGGAKGRIKNNSPSLERRRDKERGVNGDKRDHRRQSERSGDRRRRLLEKERYLLKLNSMVIQMAKDYRSVFSEQGSIQKLVSDNSQPRSPIRIQYQDKHDERAAIVRSAARNLQNVFSDIHQADRFVDWEQIRSSEEMYRSLSLSLQDLIFRTAKLCLELDNSHTPNEINGLSETGRDKDALLGLAEEGLSALAKFGSDRALNVESTAKWGTSRVRSAPNHLSSDEDEPLHLFASPMKAFIRKLLHGGPQTSSPSDEPNDAWSDNDEASETKNVRKERMAHEDPKLGVTQKLFGIVMNAIASDVRDLAGSETIIAGKVSDGDETDGRSEAERVQIERTARRMVELLDIMPTTWLPDTESLKAVLEMLCRAGTLDSARSCHDTFTRHPTNKSRLRFSLVLHAYLEAAKHEKSDEQRSAAVWEALGALHREWNQDYPRHRVERVLHTSIVLNCMCVVQRHTELENVWVRAEELVKRALGRASYTALKEEIYSNEPKVDAYTLPLVSGLAQLYALSGDKSRIGLAKKMIAYIMQHDAHGSGKFVVHPMVETFNEILRAEVREYEEEQAADEDKRVASLDYATSLLDFMLQREENGFWPNGETVELLFRLLFALNPVDIGERAEDILSKIEVRRAYSPHNNIPISLSTYHRVLRCWLEAAKREETTHAATRAMQLVNRLEVQSTPLFLTDRDVSQTNLYDISLRPNVRTYRLVNKICAETVNADAFPKAVKVAVKVYLKLMATGLEDENGVDREALLRCIYKLPPSSEERQRAEIQLRSNTSETLLAAV